ncbi:MAG: phospholipid carrier-dependent glycosyltransferase [Euryarchaeota archaeon]|nr:phospholipid carrier-dependent glycosyltransferase [Euryarchaeota archaeon]
MESPPPASTRPARWFRPAVLGLTLLFLAVGLYQLGDTRFFTSNWNPGGQGEVLLDTGAVQRVDRVYLLLQDHRQSQAEVFCGSPGDWLPRGNFSRSGMYHSWESFSTGCTTRLVRLLFRDSPGTLGEAALYAEGRQVPIRRVEGPNGTLPGYERLADEQSLLPSPPIYLQGSYFDEIYFMRTAEEHLRLEEPFEWTHPPMGKLVIAASILPLGSTPFAWRLPGVLLGALMIPLVARLARRMFQKEGEGGDVAGFFAAFLLTFDFMHFSQARLATGETAILFFVVLMFSFFWDYYEGPSKRGWKEAGMPLFLTLVFFGLGFTTKWVVFNGFLGLLALFGLMKLRELRALRQTPADQRRESFYWMVRYPVAVALAGLAAAGGIYIVSYLPYYLAGHGLQDMVNLQFSMYGFHALLTATHPFGSPWWSWPLMTTPLWAYGGELDGLVSRIVSMGNPALWWGSLIPLAILGVLAVKKSPTGGRGDPRAQFIIVPYLAQWLLFAPIPRVTFIYHYMPNLLFLVLASAWGLQRLWDLDRRARVLVLAHLAANAALFLLFYPILSGAPTTPGYRDMLKWFPSWSF